MTADAVGKALPEQVTHMSGLENRHGAGHEESEGRSSQAQVRASAGVPGQGLWEGYRVVRMPL